MTELPKVDQHAAELAPNGPSSPCSVQTKRIMVVDDQALVRDGLRFQVVQHHDLEICCEASDTQTALELVKQSDPDLVVIDTSLRDGNALDLVARIKAYDPSINMLVMSVFDDLIYAERSLSAGAQGYLCKKEPRSCVLKAIRTVLRGERYLSQQMTQRLLDPARARPDQTRSPISALSNRELEVFQLIGSGISTGTIARKLHLSRNTIESHRAKIKSKLGLKNAGELQRKAIQWVLENA